LANEIDLVTFIYSAPLWVFHYYVPRSFAPGYGTLISHCIVELYVCVVQISTWKYHHFTVLSSLL
jgi:hypothetical protein